MILRTANGRLTAILATSGVTPYRDLQWERVDAFMSVLIYGGVVYTTRIVASY